MINKVILVGRITKDPELRYVNLDIPTVKFSLAVGRNFTNKEGNKETDFISCVVWRKQAENLTKYITKGALLGIEGNIRTSSYDAPDGTRRYVTEVYCDSIQFLEPKKSNNFSDNLEINNNKKNIDIYNNEDDDDNLPF
ncbi:putative single-strand DNA-binding protein [Candidatus Phytoplasma mali]|uniref:Single-stranded DNA-binding protein n=1 Tax=Phytoplasma mali (strain AT) TaxID=482235 RepID=B3R0K2_PHYMT|nr:single-stranded DNA-binding protein [Candidatus Phytoplasma mali]CAP18366.1 putative single-strand DNA-binding protein [Candidatus Phytoplasma mali]